MSVCRCNGGMSAPLFRPEVMQTQAAQWLGSIRIGRPLSFALVTGLALACAAALVAFAVWGQYTRKVSLPGVLLPEGGVMDISSPQAATVAELLVREGDTVQAGQPLLRLSAERGLAGGSLGQLQTEALAQRRGSLEAEARLGQQQAQQRAAALTDRLRILGRERQSAEGELDALRQRLQLAQATAERFKDLGASGFVSGLQVQERQEQMLELQLRHRQAQRGLDALQRDEASVQAELRALHTTAAGTQVQIERQLSSLTQEGHELDARSGWTLVAPADGVVANLNAQRGQSAAAGQALLTLLPSDPQRALLSAQLYAPSRTAGFLAQGQAVWLRYDAFPYQKFGMQAGRVTAISRTPVNPQDLPVGHAQALLGSARAHEPLYRVTVALNSQTVAVYGQNQPLRSGMSAQAQVSLDQRAVWEWVLAPVLALGRKTAG